MFDEDPKYKNSFGEGVDFCGQIQSNNHNNLG
jgi:hypothetical protein